MEGLEDRSLPSSTPLLIEPFEVAAANGLPTGWDQWSSSSRGNAYGEYDYTLNENGKQVTYGHGPADYGTDVYTEKTIGFIDQAAADHKPFFAYLATYAPHQPATPAPRDKQLFPGVHAPRTASYDEADVSGKPASAAFRIAIRDASTRDICPAPMPSVRSREQ